jgi:excisionase family DNA binding protein
MRDVSNDGLLTSAEVADRWGVTSATVTRWARNGNLASVRTPGGRLRFRRSDVEKFLAEHDADAGEVA